MNRTDKKVLYIDLDNTLVDFPSGIAALSDEDRDAYLDRYDEVPGIFALMQPMDGALHAFHTLSAVFDTYILSTAPWLNPSAWQHKLEWVYAHLGKDDTSPAHKRLILSHHKNLNRGHFLVDDRPNNGAEEFGRMPGQEWIQFGCGDHAEWSKVTEYLLARA